MKITKIATLSWSHKRSKDIELEIGDGWKVTVRKNEQHTQGVPIQEWFEIVNSEVRLNEKKREEIIDFAKDNF